MTTSAPPTAPPRRPVLTLPSGRGNVLCRRTDAGSGTGPATGAFDFRGRTLRIEVPDPAEVLFPTDVGMSLLASIQHGPTLPVAGLRVLDVGSGSGVYSVALLAAGAASVTALDLNPACPPVAAANASINGITGGRLECVVADLGTYRPAEPFDLVVSNPPHFPYDPVYARDDGIEMAAIGGEDGRALYDTLIQRIDDLLAPDGTLVLAHSSLTDVSRTCRELGAAGYRCRIMGVTEMDIPLLAYQAHREQLMANLTRLRREGRAEFDGARFAVHTLAFSRKREYARTATRASSGWSVR
jgi:release factor glutamine methyltransferase